MYHEIEGQLSIKGMIFDDSGLTAGDRYYPYDEIESLEITSAPLFATYGILTLRTHGRDVAIPFARSRKNKLEAALREYRRLRESGTGGPSGDEPDDRKGGPAPGDPYEEVKKLKELLDMDIITKEEFETKKKQLLDL